MIKTLIGLSICVLPIGCSIEHQERNSRTAESAAGFAVTGTSKSMMPVAHVNAEPMSPAPVDETVSYDFDIAVPNFTAYKVDYQIEYYNYSVTHCENGEKLSNPGRYLTLKAGTLGASTFGAKAAEIKFSAKIPKQQRDLLMMFSVVKVYSDKEVFFLSSPPVKGDDVCRQVISGTNPKILEATQFSDRAFKVTDQKVEATFPIRLRKK